MTTDSGLVFFGDDAESFEAVDASSGEPLWHYHTGQTFTASPMSFRTERPSVRGYRRGQRRLHVSLA